jgi:L-lactate dehydrogenase complex protein LldG
MNSRESILAAVKKSQPDLVPLPEQVFSPMAGDNVERFQTVLESIGGKVYIHMNEEDIAANIGSLFPQAKRVVSVKHSVNSYVINDAEPLSHHSFEDVDVAIMRAQFGVAENGAVWVTEDDMQIRVLPFICQHLVIIVREDQIVGTMHEAYDKIGSADYGFGVFIAGPSKTADIEQSLVLGAHGPLSAHVFIIKGQN